MTGSFLDTVFACPMCRGYLDCREADLVCGQCGESYPQAHPGIWDLMPPGAGTDDWQRRQAECDQWYRELFGDPELARACYKQDLTPLASELASLRGVVLDIGGGNGVTRAYLPADAHYLVVEPSRAWAAWDRSVVGGPVSTATGESHFVRGIGEQLPIRDGTVDAAIALWSMNHVTDPERVVAEIARVTRPGGAGLLVFEDVEPGWADLVWHRPWRGGARAGRAAMMIKFRTAFGGKWPLQSDHLRIEERLLRNWLAPAFLIEKRSWITSYLVLRLKRK